MIVDYYIKVAAKTAAQDTGNGQKLFSDCGDRYDFQTIDSAGKQTEKDSNCIDIGANAGHILQEILKYVPL